MWGVYVYEVNQDSNVKGPYYVVGSEVSLFACLLCFACGFEGLN